MLTYALHRLGVGLLVALTVSLVTFSMIFASGDPAIAMAGEGARAEDIENVRRFYGFDRPVAVQYLDWLRQALQGGLCRPLTPPPPGAGGIPARPPTPPPPARLAPAFPLAPSVPLGGVGAV